MAGSKTEHGPEPEMGGSTTGAGRLLAAAGLAAATLAGPTAGQEAPAGADVPGGRIGATPVGVVAGAAGPAGTAPADTTELASGPYAHMSTLLEKTLFQVNVAELTLRYDSATAARIREVAADGEYSERAADSITSAVLRAERLHGRLEFRRGVGLGRFLESLRTNMEKARDAGILADSAYSVFRGRLRGWYSELEGRGVREGDVTEYRIQGDTLRVIFRSADGEVLIDRRDVGEQHRRAVLGGYLAPGADFREGLVRSLYREDQGSDRRHRVDARRVRRPGPSARPVRTRTASGWSRTPR